MTTLAYAAVCRSGLSFDKQLWLRPEIVPGLRDITDAVHREGAAAAIQIGHCGNMTHYTTAGQIPIGASTGFNLYAYTPVRGMRPSEIEQVARDFGTAVRHGPRRRIRLAWRCTPGTATSFRSSSRPTPTTAATNTAARSKTGCASCACVWRRSMERPRRDGHGGTREAQHVRRIQGRHRNPREHRDRPRDRSASAWTASFSRADSYRKAPMAVMRGLIPIYTMSYYSPLWLRYFIRWCGPFMIRQFPFEECYFLEDAKKFRAALKLSADLRGRAGEPRRNRPGAGQRVRTGADGPGARQRPGFRRTSCARATRRRAARATTATTASPACIRST